MALTPGTRLGVYEVTALIGVGGMGEVHKATDTNLKRAVAIKVLPALVAADAERLARFQREAEVLAALNHPNIAAIYGLERSGTITALVMELVEGDDLSQRIARGAIPIDEALPIAKQIAEALEAAHEQGIIHRDLKPANIKVRADGTVKVLDFGLAKAMEPAAGSSPSVSMSPTITTPAMTQAGILLGTAAYMAPEQARGKAADRRADVWAFGVIVFEMLAGQRLFTGETISDTLASVLKTDPNWRALPVAVPPRLRRLLRWCLDKDPKRRLQAIGDARVQIEDLLAGAPEDADAIMSQVRSKLPWPVAAALVILAGIGGAGWWRATRPLERALLPLVRLNVDLGPDAVAGPFITTAVSPDGTRLVFPTKSPDGKPMLAMRLLDETKPTVLSGTENGRDPFFSHDGKWIGFFADGHMKKISVQGGAPVALCDAPNDRGASWGEDGSIIVALNTVGTLSRVPGEGGSPQPVTTLEGALSHRWPQLLPGSEAVLFTLSSSIVAFEGASIVAVSLKTGEIKTLVRGGYFGRYLPTGDATGHLVYVHEGVLFGVPFDPARLELRGAGVPLLEDLAADPTSGAGEFSFSGVPSGPGTFVYRTGKVSSQNWPVWWLDSSSKTQPLIATPGLYAAPRFSPDGQRLALAQTVGGKQGIFVYDWPRETMSRLSFDTDTQQTTYPTWSQPDGKHIVFTFRSVRGYGLGWIRADGTGEIQRLLDSKNLIIPYSFFPDGRLAYDELNPGSGLDLWTLALDVSDPDHPKPGKPEVFLRTPSNEHRPAVSPDGRWIAYQSDESGRDELYVRPFPGPGGKSQISNTGGQLPIWSRSGPELFFQSLDNRIMVEDYTATGDSFMPKGKPRVWSDQQLLGNGPLNYDLAPDGKRFAIFPNLTPPTEERGAVHVNFLVNFFDELRRRVPLGK